MKKTQKSFLSHPVMCMLAYNLVVRVQKKEKSYQNWCTIFLLKAHKNSSASVTDRHANIESKLVRTPQSSCVCHSVHVYLLYIIKEHFRQNLILFICMYFRFTMYVKQYSTKKKNKSEFAG